MEYEQKKQDCVPIFHDNLIVRHYKLLYLFFLNKYGNDVYFLLFLIFRLNNKFDFNYYIFIILNKQC